MFMLSFIDPAIVLSMFMLSFTDPAIILSMFMLSFTFVIVCDLFEWKRICAGILSFIYVHVAVRDAISKTGRVLDPTNGFDPSTFVSVSCQDLDFWTYNVICRGYLCSMNYGEI